MKLGTDVSTNRQCFFDRELLDETKTTAESLLHSPIRREITLRFDAPWEKCWVSYPCLLKDDGLFRLYYITDGGEGAVVCYAESRDGLHWERPHLGLFSFGGSTENNILMDKTVHCCIDNFTVFKDTCPTCRPQERYKALASYSDGPQGKPWEPTFGLYLYVSPDGIHFERRQRLLHEGNFDSLNTCFWDEEKEEYRCYFRHVHDIPEGMPDTVGGRIIRDIRTFSSKDFVTWTEPQPITYSDGEDVQMYTNNIQKYDRAPGVLIGFPVRYIEREGWSGCFEELTGKEERLERMKSHPRAGLAMTDCAFMTTRNRVDFTRYNEAFSAAGPERGINWVYGDEYFALGMMELPSYIEGSDPELNLFAMEGHAIPNAEAMRRYTIRRDGFVSLHAGNREKTVTTKFFRFEGDTLRINFATSARGYLDLTLVTPDGKTVAACRQFGDSTERKVHFDGEIKALAGSPVRMEAKLFECDWYSFRFE